MNYRLGKDAIISRIKDNFAKLSLEKGLNGKQQTILDIFRVVAAMSVIIGHSLSFYSLTMLKDETYFPYIQNMGVVIFFLLSGFLTAYSITNKNRDHKYTFSKFFKHKFFRIAREYIPGLVIIAIIDIIAISLNGDRYSYYQAFNIKQFIGNALMLQNMGPHHCLDKFFIPFGSGRPLWTLSIEWWLYMLFGVVYIFISNKENLSFSKILIFLVSYFMCCHYLISGRGHGLGLVFAFGMLIYYLYHLISTKAAIIIFPISCLFYIFYGLLVKNAYKVGSFIILFLILFSAIKMFDKNEQITKRNSLLAFVSKSTFMLYLIHYSIIDLIVNINAPWSIMFKFILGVVLSLLVSFAAYYIFGEKNTMGNLLNWIINNLKNKS